ncbi:glycosyl transferase, family 2 [Aeropyrum pernix]|uniref:Glycosyl transferase, family 2 n=1 Tax=Aeropyrum pernix TaxID=56636 RepID=A0A401HBK1_AERPX|nr:glycosyltransferase family A protein [Aeropyrum pernix]GBF09728.1 glycosyl transferase, family 2 [Aeropyrum pernix]
MDEPLVSIIIPTYNSEKTLPLCLESIRRQTYRNIEVIIVDNFSTDRTVKIAERYGARVYLKGPERSAQKNFGALKARGEYVYFIDSDFVLHPRVVEECVSLAKQGYDAIIVLNVSYPKPSLVAKARFFERLSYYGSGVYEAARFIRKDLFIKVGGFDVRLYANEDYDLHRRLIRIGARVARTRRSFEIHIGEPSSLRELIVKSVYYGSSIKHYFGKNPNVLHMTPIRPTFFKREYIAYLGRRWLLGMFLVPLIKVIQAIATLLGILIKLSTSPYLNLKMRPHTEAKLRKITTYELKHGVNTESHGGMHRISRNGSEDNGHNN